MNATLFFDSLLTVLLSLALIGAGGLTLWLLPWTDADRAGTVRGLSSVVRNAAQVPLRASARASFGEVAGRPRSPFRVASSR
ncbi:MAG: hypothetical protein V4850_34620 [Myxococcota bacterium]